jgi:hypothetical protein
MDETWLELAPPAEHGMDAGLYRADGSPAYAG